MKKMILGLAAMVMVSVSFAQPGPGKKHSGRRPGMEMSKLNLTESQKEQVKTVNQDFRQQMQELNKKENITVKEQRDQRAQLAKTHKEKIEALLTPEQKKQLAQVKAERKDRMQQMGARRMDKMKEQLSLTDAQVTTLKNSHEQARNRIQAILKDDNIQREDKKQQVMAIRKEMKNTMDQVLTPEQKSKMESLRKDQHDRRKNFKGRHMDPKDNEIVK